MVRACRLFLSFCHGQVSKRLLSIVYKSRLLRWLFTLLLIVSHWSGCCWLFRWKQYFMITFLLPCFYNSFTTLYCDMMWCRLFLSSCLTRQDDIFYSLLSTGDSPLFTLLRGFCMSFSLKVILLGVFLILCCYWKFVVGC